MAQYQVEEIKRLIKKGFKLELISFELDIPMEIVENCKKSIEERSEIEKGKIGNEDDYTYNIINEIRNRYKSLYWQTAEVVENSIQEIAEQDIELTDLVIEIIQEKIQALSKCEKYGKMKIISAILTEVKKIEERPVTIEQCEKLIPLLESEELRVPTDYDAQFYSRKFNLIKLATIKKMAKLIDAKQQETEDIEELKMLRKKLPTDDKTIANVIRTKIDSKILRLQHQNAIDKMRNNIPENILGIITDLTNGTIDIGSAKAIIEEEAKNRIENNPKTKFALTQEQKEKQILMQIKTTIMEQTDKYTIANPEEMVISLKELCGGELEQAVRVVVKNLIGRKDFETAKAICNKFLGKNNDNYVRILRGEIRNAEIGDIVLRVIKMDASVEEERKCFELIEKGIKKGNINLSAISLGKSKDGTRNISLASVWEDENTKRK